MKARNLIPLAAAFGLLAGAPLMAEPKAKTSAVENQKLADMVASQLKASGVAKGSKINIETRDGVVLLKGTAVSDQQIEQILRQMTKVKGITRVETDINVMDASVRRTNGEGDALVQAPPMALPGGAGGVPVLQDPAPLGGHGPMMAPVDPAGPKLPPYAWPTYAPYNNYSRVAYPGAYPYQAFPYIGPFYPFPKVPLGWRKVVLEWDDGHWYLGRLSNPHDYWRVKFW